MAYLFTSESVSEGHPDKVADQISDALLDEFLRHDPKSKVACETLVTTGLIVCSGEVKTEGYVDIQKIARETVRRIGYVRSDYQFEAESCGVISCIHEQSPDISQGVEKSNDENQGAGDQGMMFGYAVREMENFMPLPIELSHILLHELAAIRHEGVHMTYLRPDSKAQVTVEYDDNNVAVRLDTVVISTQHDPFGGSDTEMQDHISNDIRKILIPRVRDSITLPERISKFFDEDYKLLVNPTGKFVIGGPHGDTGLTGRKIIVDTYGGKGAHGGGAFSGKDASKVDRSAAYATRHIAKNLVAAGIADEVLVQVAYAIGVAEPVGLYINTYGTARVKMDDPSISRVVKELFDLRPYSVIRRFGLKNPIFSATSAYGHFGRAYHQAEIEVYYTDSDTYSKVIDGKKRNFKMADMFAWEKLDEVERLKKAFNIG
ncbi:MAG: methionine adenosyltransferase [Bacteroidales bacterium]